ncbi:mucin-2-like [Anguilla rostrata]|uniref:mucin-2-like n=1 Tax=Anguilla rostrata TaxID=7938 RepID=UPI0030D395B3
MLNLEYFIFSGSRQNTCSSITGSLTVPTQVLILQATLEVPFVPALENSQSTEYQELATTVIGFYDVIFSSRYGLLFERTEVRSFSRREEGTAVEVALIFNGTSSETLPSTDDVAETLIRAVTDPDSTLTTQFNVTVVVDSIRVLTPTPTTPEVPVTGSPLPAATTTVPTQVLILQATLEVPFVPALENSQSTEYQELATTVIGFCDVIFSIRYGILFERTEVRSFSRREEGTAVEVALIFNGTSSETLPSTDDVAETLIRAVTDPDSTLTTQFNVTVVVDSIRVLTPTPTTPEVPVTGSPLPAATTTVPTQVLILQTTLEVPFVPALENSQSTEYQELATTVIGFCDVIFSIRYGILFERTEVRSFSRREEGTAVEVALIFNGTSSETLPSTDDVAETLIRAVTDPDSTLTTQFNVTVVVDSIRVLTPTSTTGSPLPAATTTVPTQVLILQTTLEVPFVPALENSQSTEYQVLATTVVGFYDVIFRIRYGILFERTEVRSFSRREEGTAVEVALIFNGTRSETLPARTMSRRP